MSDYFPQEIWEEILHRQTLKSLVKCTSVCKEWKSLITDLGFISDQIDRNIQINGNQPLFLLRRKFGRTGTEFYSLHLDNQQLDLLSILECPFKDCLCKHRLVATCNGLVLLATNDLKGFGNNFTLWNPSIRKYVVLPEPCVTFRTHDNFHALLGFGFDSRTKDFKVVILVDCSKSPKVEVYSLAGGCWKSTFARAPSFSIEVGSFTFMNGALHWVVRRTRTNDRFILSFDVVEETFGELMLPQTFPEPIVNAFVLKGGESLAVVYITSWFPYTSFSIWVMKEYGIVESWTKVFSYASEIGIISTPLGFRKNGEVVLKNSKGEIFSVGPVTELVKNLGVNRDRHAYLHHHVESLFLLEKETDTISY